MNIRGYFFWLTIIPLISWGQMGTNSEGSDKKVRLVFYNVENLYDIYNDSLTNDDEFTPEGERHWNNYRFYQKLNNLSKVIISIGEWNPPAVIGLCEVENRFVLNKLIYDTPLKNFGYHIIHFDSPDRRGIDVALLYRQSVFEPLYFEAVPVHFPDNPGLKTRDILYVKGILDATDTVHFFVNHWPSRYGGYEDSRPRRIFVAKVLRNKVDSILAINPSPNIIIMGDFNDEARDESITEGLDAKTDTTSINNGDLVALLELSKKKQTTGTNKYGSEWSVIDQFIVSGNLLNDKNSLGISKEGAVIYRESFLLEKDETHMGLKLNRTFVGPVYHGGFSDHLPVYVDLIFRKN